MANRHQHVGLLVEDLDRAVDFYVDVFDAKHLLRPVKLGPPYAAVVMDGPPETAYEFAMVAITEGTFIEFFRFPGDDKPAWLRPNRGLIPHMGLQVDDVEATLVRAEKAGGSRVWPEVGSFGTAKMIYLKDPDGNNIEIMDMSTDEIIGELIAQFPEAKPSPTRPGAA